MWLGWCGNRPKTTIKYHLIISIYQKMATIKNEGLQKYLHVGLRATLQQIVNEYEKQNGSRNSADKLFIVVSPEDEKEYIAALRSKGKVPTKGIKSVAIALIEDGKKNFAHPYLLPLLMEVVGDKKKRRFDNLEYKGGCLVIDGGKAFKPKQDEAPAPEAKQDEAKDEQPAEKKSRKSKKAVEGEDENADAGQA